MLRCRFPPAPHPYISRPTIGTRLDSQLSQYTVRRPDGTIFSQWSHSSPQSVSRSYWFWSLGIGAGEMQGLWRFTVEFDSTDLRTAVHGRKPRRMRTCSGEAFGRVPSSSRRSALDQTDWGASCNPSRHRLQASTRAPSEATRATPGDVHDERGPSRRHYAVPTAGTTS
jgi:hypothetical protein